MLLNVAPAGILHACGCALTCLHTHKPVLHEGEPASSTHLQMTVHPCWPELPAYVTGTGPFLMLRHCSCCSLVKSMAAVQGSNCPMAAEGQWCWRVCIKVWQCHCYLPCQPTPMGRNCWRRLLWRHQLVPGQSVSLISLIILIMPLTHISPT